MQKRREGQSIPEMAMVLPVLLLVLFGIMDFGWYIYSYATIYQAARNGAEVAAGAPPAPGTVNDDVHSAGGITRGDQCVDAIVDAAGSGVAELYPEIANHVSIAYPGYQLDRDGSELAHAERRRIGYPIEVAIVDYTIEPLTPLWQLVPLGTDGEFTLTIVTRRSIEAFARDPDNPQLSACAID